AGAPGRQSTPPRLRTRHRGELRNRGRARRRENPGVTGRESPELRPSAALGRPPVVADARLQHVRRSRGRPRARRPRRPRVVAGYAGHCRRSPPRTLTRPSRSGVHQQPARLRCGLVLALEDGTHGIVGVDTKYHEWAKPEIPKPSNLTRYLEVAETAGIFARGALDSVKGRSTLAVMWLEHLLLLSMLQHASGAWSRGRYVVVHPAGNEDVAGACGRYRDLLAEQSTFSSVTIEELLDTSVLPSETTSVLRERYVPG